MALPHAEKCMLRASNAGSFGSDEAFVVARFHSM